MAWGQVAVGVVAVMAVVAVVMVMQPLQHQEMVHGTETKEPLGDILFSLWNKLPRLMRVSAFNELMKETDFNLAIKRDCDGTSNDVRSLPQDGLFSVRLQSASVGCAGRQPDASINVYRFGNIVSFPYVSGCTAYSDLLSAIRIQFADPKISLLWLRDGTPINLDDLVRPPPPAKYKQFLIATRPMRSPYYSYENEERFYYPTMEIGETVTVYIPDGTDAPPRAVNLTTVSMQPKIIELTPYLTHAECDEILAHIFNLPQSSKDKWKKSTVGTDYTNEADGGTLRVSSTLWLGDIHENSIPASSIAQNLAQALLKHPPELMEPLQVVRYPAGGHYYFHTDSATPFEQSMSNSYISNGGNRYATIIVYLTEPTRGGHTAFPLSVQSPVPYDADIHSGRQPTIDSNIGCDASKSLVVYPKKGSAVLFYDLIEDAHMAGITDIRTTHAGCDTFEGTTEKIIMNQWLRNKRVRVGDKWTLYDNNW